MTYCHLNQEWGLILSNFKKWLKAKTCQLLGHDVVRGNKCPVTGIVKLTCNKCGASNVPEHNTENRFQ